MAAASTPARSSAHLSQPVRVVLRVRPFLSSEAASATAPCVSLLGCHPGGGVTVHLKDQHTRYANRLLSVPAHDLERSYLFLR